MDNNPSYATRYSLYHDETEGEALNSGVLIRVEPHHITYISRIMEGYEYLGVVTTLNRSEGLLLIRSTSDTCYEARAVLASLPIRVEFVN